MEAKDILNNVLSVQQKYREPIKKEQPSSQKEESSKPVKNKLYLRIGYQSTDKFLKLKDGITGGIGLKFNNEELTGGWGIFSGAVARIDYAIFYNKNLEMMVHNISFEIGF